MNLLKRFSPGSLLRTAVNRQRKFAKSVVNVVRKRKNRTLRALSKLRLSADKKIMRSR